MDQNIKILASSWNDGVFVLDDKGLSHELSNRSVRGLCEDQTGGAFAIVDGHNLYQRSVDGHWNRIATSDFILSVTFAINGHVYVGTDDARVLLLSEGNSLKQIDCFDSIEGRDSWIAGTAIVNGEEVGPPLGVRSLSGAADGRIFANVHVGGIPYSPDGGVTWVPTIDVNLDAHEVRVNPADSNLVCAATASGLCISRDGGNSWTLHTDGLHASYCSAVAFANNNIFVAASEGHFSSEGAIYRLNVNAGNEQLEQVGGGLPDWLGGIADTLCIASRHEDMVVISASGEVFVSTDAGFSWKKKEENVVGVSSVLIVR